MKKSNKIAWPSEKFVTDSILKVLCKKGYKPQAERSLYAHGADIMVRHPKQRHYIFVECKGYPKTPSEGVQRDQYFLTVLGQILLRMKQKNAWYAVAFPYHDFYKKRILSPNFHLPRKWLGLWFFLVRRDGSVMRLVANRKVFSSYS